MDAEERRRTMDFILQQQAKFDASINELRENDAKADVRLTRLENILRGAIRTGLRERREWREKYAALVNAQIGTEDSVRALKDSTHELTVSMGELKNSTHELKNSTHALKDSMGELRELTERNSQGIEALREATQRNTVDINRLAKIVERIVTPQNGEDAGRDSDKGE